MSSNGTLVQLVVSGDDLVSSGTAQRLSAGPGWVQGFAWAPDGGMYVCHSLQVLSCNFLPGFARLSIEALCKLMPA